MKCLVVVTPPSIYYFSYGLCQELVIFQAIWCLYFPLLISCSTKRNNIYYVTRILYRLSCLVSLCTYFSSPVANHLLWSIVVELFSVPVILPLTILTKIVGIKIIHSKDWSINYDTPIFGLKIPLHLEIILPCMFSLINILICGIIYFSYPCLIYLKINTNLIWIGTIIHLSKTIPCIWNTKFQGWGVRSEIPPVFVKPN